MCLVSTGKYSHVVFRQRQRAGFFCFPSGFGPSDRTRPFRQGRADEIFGYFLLRQRQSTGKCVFFVANAKVQETYAMLLFSPAPRYRKIVLHQRQSTRDFVGCVALRRQCQGTGICFACQGPGIRRAHCRMMFGVFGANVDRKIVCASPAPKYRKLLLCFYSPAPTKLCFLTQCQSTGVSVGCAVILPR